MICAIRIRGEIGLDSEVVETLNRLRLKRKYSCIVINPKKEQLAMIKHMRDSIAFGEIDDKTFEKLVSARAQLIDLSKKVDAKKVVEGIKAGKKYEDMNLKAYFRLHPPRGGIDSKIHFPKGVLGNHGKEINKLVERML